MLSLFRNRWERILTKKAVIIIAVIIIPLMIGVAMMFSGKPVFKETIAFVTEQDEVQHMPSDSAFRVVTVHQKPNFSDLVLGKYAAIVEKNQRHYKVTTLKSKADQKMIQQFFETGKMPGSYRGEDELRTERGTGTNILGFIVMLVLVQGVALAALYPEDRMLKTFRRILVSPVHVGKYLFVQFIFTFLCLYIPTYLAIVITHVLFHAEIGFRLDILAGLLCVLTVLATAFAIFMASVMDRNISLMTSGISVITCVLSGCFISFAPHHPLLNALCAILPQKAYMTFIHGVEMGHSMWEYKAQVVYILMWSAVFCFLGGFITRRRTNKGIYE
ncbi:ABC transporter permease [Bacillus inaquosorum]|uniref:ABC transporter permease n=1 Tax=Bacillus inaquosorum TaxID=483913 RepID=UPI00227E50E8|nr:ABC transporter permease [Bacillus inaquosorum]MCY7900646.1 ABC transporter permease [Bacillus inaquosorum]MCY7981319.1 ABC transporter permease [Bacillus inaquosorum]MCY8069729.1 ABC transporter permease [Bacillus inaquosorum]MCY8238810.1 ABC transporter permease [Bacillus inaquosorum]MCY8264328.1 ABC transporter permease [Bacillus inaquosorum]